MMTAIEATAPPLYITNSTGEFDRKLYRHSPSLT